MSEANSGCSGRDVPHPKAHGWKKVWFETSHLYKLGTSILSDACLSTGVSMGRSLPANLRRAVTVLRRTFVMVV